MFEGFVSSKVRRAVMQRVLTQPTDRFHVRGLAKELGISVGTLHRELKRFERLGLLKSRQEGLMRSYRLDQCSTMYQQLQGLSEQPPVDATQELAHASDVDVPLAGLEKRLAVLHVEQQGLAAHLVQVQAHLEQLTHGLDGRDSTQYAQLLEALSRLTDGKRLEGDLAKAQESIRQAEDDRRAAHGQLAQQLTRVSQQLQALRNEGAGLEDRFTMTRRELAHSTQLIQEQGVTIGKLQAKLTEHQKAAADEPRWLVALVAIALVLLLGLVGWWVSHGGLSRP